MLLGFVLRVSVAQNRLDLLRPTYCTRETKRTNGKRLLPNSWKNNELLPPFEAHSLVLGTTSSTEMYEIFLQLASGICCNVTDGTLSKDKNSYQRTHSDRNATSTGYQHVCLTNARSVFIGGPFEVIIDTLLFSNTTVK